ncbi:MAG: hypothetical protein OES70_12100, partial [Desulfobacterales bacterium]|nr:hypothetical protein [Desulfobacterales bacterium]
QATKHPVLHFLRIGTGPEYPFLSLFYLWPLDSPIRCNGIKKIREKFYSSLVHNVSHSLQKF